MLKLKDDIKNLVMYYFLKISTKPSGSISHALKVLKL